MLTIQEMILRHAEKLEAPVPGVDPTARNTSRAMCRQARRTPKQVALIFEDRATRHAELMARCTFNLGVIWVHESCTACHDAICLKDNEWTYEEYCSAACSLRDACKL